MYGTVGIVFSLGLKVLGQRFTTSLNLTTKYDLVNYYFFNFIVIFSTNGHLEVDNPETLFFFFLMKVRVILKVSASLSHHQFAHPQFIVITSFHRLSRNNSWKVHRSFMPCLQQVQSDSKIYLSSYRAILQREQVCVAHACLLASAKQHNLLQL